MENQNKAREFYLMVSSKSKYIFSLLVAGYVVTRFFFFFFSITS